MIIDRDADTVMLSQSGRLIDLLEPKSETISIRDIAGHLAKINRFAGATSVFYSVAQHSIVVSQLMAGHGPRGQLYGLMHDAHEAYIGDIPQPMRRVLAVRGGLSELSSVSARLDQAIFQRIGLLWPVPTTIDTALTHADMRALATEKRDLMPAAPPWLDLPAPWRATIKPWPWAKAEEKFLETYDTITAACGLRGWRDE